MTSLRSAARLLRAADSGEDPACRTPVVVLRRVAQGGAGLLGASVAAMPPSQLAG
nr:hypothetical protein OG999_13460 [Streptomyces sp. NBC_00886]